MPTSEFYLLTAISNLHAGSGEGDFSIVDKQVQRDSITALPVIHASGIKGALREAAELPARNPAAATIETVFGSEPGDGKSLQGLYQFHDAKLLCLPVRSSHHLYYRATCPHIVQELANSAAVLGKAFAAGLSATLAALATLQPQRGAPLYLSAQPAPGLRLEDWTAQHQSPPAGFDAAAAKAVFGERLALLHDDDFKELSQALPVIARNYLENGISQNLWYEEVVPRESRFFFPVIRPDGDQLLDQILTQLNHRLQVGANATVGYGLCQIQAIA